MDREVAYVLTAVFAAAIMIAVVKYLCFMP